MVSKEFSKMILPCVKSVLVTGIAASNVAPDVILIFFSGLVLACTASPKYIRICMCS